MITATGSLQGLQSSERQAVTTSHYLCKSLAVGSGDALATPGLTPTAATRRERDTADVRLGWGSSARS